MRCIATGGCGFIGFNLVKELVAQGHDVFVIDDMSTGYEANKVEGVVEYYLGDVKTTMSISASRMEWDIDVIFHLACVPRVSYSVEYPRKTTEKNVMSTVAVLEAVRTFKWKKQPRVVYSSSSSVYGGVAPTPTKESYTANPQSPYALQKLQGEEWCRMYSKLYGLDTVCLRYFNVFGPGSRFGGAYSTVLSAWLYHLYIDSSYKPFLEGDGSQSRDFCFVNNVVNANIAAAKYTFKFSGQPINVAQGRRISLMGCVELLEEIAGKKLELEYRPERVGDVKVTHADLSEAKQYLQYDPDTDFESQVTEMAAWYKDEYCEEVSI